jgi:hypothetical protein
MRLEWSEVDAVKYSTVRGTVTTARGKSGVLITAEFFRELPNGRRTKFYRPEDIDDLIRAAEDCGRNMDNYLAERGTAK